MRSIFFACLITLSLITTVFADEGIFTNADGHSKYYRDGQYVAHAFKDTNGNWRRSDTNMFIGDYFRDAYGYYRYSDTGEVFGRIVEEDSK